MTGSESFFDSLRSQRKSQHIEISEICEFTKINSQYIEAIECGDFNVLPNVYMRLFLKSYATFIGADSVKVIEDYELYTTGKISKSEKLTIQDDESDTNSSSQQDSKLDSFTQISPNQIATGGGTILAIFILLWWTGRVTREQTENIGSTPSYTDISENINQPLEKSSEISEVNTEAVESEPSDYLPIKKEEANRMLDPLLDKLPLNANDFLLKNRTRQSTNIVKLFEPYSITILTLEETKLNISKSDGNQLTILINSVVAPHSEYQFEFESTINIEFWNNRHIKVKLNEIPLDIFLSDDGLSVRGSYEATISQLYLGFYKN